MGAVFIFVPAYGYLPKAIRLNSVIFFPQFFIVLYFHAISYPLGERLRLVDCPDEERKRHKRPTPLTGGIAIYCAFVGRCC